MNNACIIGRLTKDVEVKSSQSGMSVCNFMVAVQRNFKNANGECEADFINCVCFKGTADFMGRFLNKGMQIAVTGRIQTRTYDNDQGQKIYITEIVANEVRSLEKIEKKQNYNVSANAGPGSFMQPQESTITDDDLPF